MRRAVRLVSMSLHSAYGILADKQSYVIPETLRRLRKEQSMATFCRRRAFTLAETEAVS